ncbi:sensor histidine kinase [Brevundimonas goettingensis]|uniref:histidine kinase n=1 Tax=Brevundimonas goettingensis TaxID=2774190 RepID=A0A975C571_9CAUL|nr:HAMP domain-containing sensor histidine kinase [Brevundimonas goettingensis]QTC92674.1 HAMP domain-containing histidine kinase [Brevundimonas goettingensis]
MQDERFRGLIELQASVKDAGADLTAIMRAIVSEYSVMPQANGIVVELRDTDQVYYAAASGTSEHLVGLRLPVNGSLSGLCILTGRPLSCEDSETDARVNRAACRRVNLRSMIVVPIPHQGQTVGVLKYYSADPAAFSDEDMMLAHLLVGPIAVGFSSVAESDAHRITDELRRLIEMKQDFVARVTHELRTPLTAINGALGLVVSGAGGVLPPQAENIVGIAARNAGRMKRLVDDLLTFEKVSAGPLEFDFQPVNVALALRETVEDNQAYAEQHTVDIRLEAPDDPLWVVADAHRLTQCVTNLLSNAIKFSPPNAEVRVNLAQAGDEILIAITDQGPGVSPAFRDRLFQPFAQDSSVVPVVSTPSTGLGLAITRTMIDQMGGTVSLGDTSDRGATFVIALPRTEPPVVLSKASA